MDEENDIEPTETVYRHDVVLVKTSKRATPDDKLKEQVASLLAKISTPGRILKGWTFAWDEKITDEPNEVAGSSERTRGKRAQIHNYKVKFDIICRPTRPRAGIDGEFQNIVGVLVASSNRHPFFNVATVDGETVDNIVELTEIKSSGMDDFVGYAPFTLPQNARELFGHIYDREAQINVLLSAVEAAMASDWDKRFHVVLEGPPACGKTEILNTIKAIAGRESVLVFDGTSTTQAGAQKEFMEREELPRILIIEEIEKTDESALRYLLGLLDTRGEIRKQTAREKIVRDARVLCLATVNDIDKFKGMLSGALASRFAHELFCPRPDRDLMRKILRREVLGINGKETWIEPTLDYMQEIGSSDPRKAIAICLSGREGWTDGKYPEMLRRIRKIGEVLQNVK